jgi:hypothetical protein
MAERYGSLLSVRKDVRVLDCTVRDGGLVNNFEFSDEFVRDLYLANIKAGVDYMELLLSFLRNPKYNKMAVMNFVEKQMVQLKEDGVLWGYDIAYLLTGILNSHPSSAIQFIKEGRKDYAMFYQNLLDDAL